MIIPVGEREMVQVHLVNRPMFNEDPVRSSNVPVIQAALQACTSTM